ncbi:glycerol-3-phosphate dehydrogenase/oxidase [Ornithinimicrobium faecis]|uniref:Glycerol-3-phosphate dehydrogenase n=1 Tax=Ornithinimicrobium faecis TaxID=2934158 RepID=A0ABY4YPN4_9MICO|nr:glycerol-3-phosphate dehydrogenase/oxidase [Ornithinimicrobium sp. HY1793]USQ78574.1 glycerol-3-phosphate dehydrogenase/oxidase [Ornithinimicrobium sp. HY1793]
MQPRPLTTKSRQAALAALADSGAGGAEIDVLVIGGGVTGAGTALDAATRGLSTVVVEAQDWASGTSSRSTKLVHGGLRYLQMLDFKLVHEALTERGLLLSKIAPHLVKPMAFLIPLEHRIWQRAYYGAGVSLYDLLANIMPGRRALPIHQHTTRKGMLKQFPDLKHDTAIGAVKYWDATVDDARLVATLIRTATTYGAHAATRTQVTKLTKDASGRVNGAILQDLETGAEITARARHVINATGVWTEDTEQLADTSGGLRVLASKGIHLVIPRERIKGTSGLFLQTEKSVLFFIPWSRYWILGTTDTPWELDPQHPVPTAADIDYVLAHANEVLTTQLTREDVVGSYAGLRPLLQPGTKEGTDSAKVSREHTVASPVPGLTIVAGGKLTTYRVMAKDAVDFAIGGEAVETPSITHEIPLVGAEGEKAVRRQAARWRKEFDWSEQMVDHLLHRYGSLLTELVESIREDPSLGRPLQGAPAYLRAEIAYAASHEGALHLEDIMYLRTRLNYEAADRGQAALVEIAGLAGDVLGWDEERRQREVDAYRALAAAEEQAALQPDDESAERVRSQAPDLTPMAPVGTQGN